MNASKAKGTAAETEVVKSLKAVRAIPAQRVALAGTFDYGDVWAFPLTTGGARIVFEVKAGDQTKRPSWRQIDEWFSEAAREGFRVPGCELAVLVLKRHGSGNADDWHAYVNLAQYLRAVNGDPCDCPGRGVLTDVGIVVQLRLGTLLDHLADHYGRNQE